MDSANSVRLNMSPVGFRDDCLCTWILRSFQHLWKDASAPPDRVLRSRGRVPCAEVRDWVDDVVAEIASARYGYDRINAAAPVITTG